MRSGRLPFRIGLGAAAGVAAALPAFAVGAAWALIADSRLEVWGAAAAAGIASGIAVAMLAQRAARHIEEATGLAKRFAAGETHLRLDADQGLRSYRALATILNSIADQIVESEMKYRLISEATGDALWEWNALTNRTTWDGELRTLFGIDSDHLEERYSWWNERVHPDDRPAVEHRLDKALASVDRHWSDEYRFRREDGEYRWFWDRGLIVRNAAGKALRLVGCMTDITAQRTAEERIWQLAHHDELTGLANRAFFYARVEELIRASETGRCGALLLIDLDQFKDVNDTLGHAAGDALLRGIAGRLEHAFGEAGVVSRLGGDEFAIYVPGPATIEDAQQLGQGLLQAISDPLEVEGNTILSKATVGIAFAPQHGASASELLKNADIALYSGKGRGRDQIVLFEPAMRAETDQRVALYAEVRQGLAADLFEPFYQPIVSLKDGSVQGVEALMRWRHPTRGLLTPGQFMPAFGDADLALQLGSRLMEHVVADFRSWYDAGLAPDYVAINVSPSGFRRQDLAKRLLGRFRAAGLPASCLCVEVTETVLLGRHSGPAEQNLRELHEAGARIALDDFGTGFASLTHLQQYPVDIIKIDQSFVRSLATDAGSQAIISTVLELGRRLDKSVVAEGVETSDHVMMLRAAGCALGQGYHFARPMPADTLRELMAMEGRSPAAQRLERAER